MFRIFDVVNQFICSDRNGENRTFFNGNPSGFVSLFNTAVSFMPLSADKGLGTKDRVCWEIKVYCEGIKVYRTCVVLQIKSEGPISSPSLHVQAFPRRHCVLLKGVSC